ncbi:fungal specific transcription factor domain protein [Metarhizium robertsii]|uniref:Transcription factor STE12 n=2 Tax=Metarhizium robertsii TaxID=568076 RepID=E9FDV1_METRA|nr:transcription factor STE12 [Metarhizium robertsii ARSEF 23]EFY94094.1 transcription factor STE12 [Metarhizium robertsii ARSEF 23]EXU95142.1 fungal specific transcription factor domain protein [Metarhizium robertsii]
MSFHSTWAVSDKTPDDGRDSQYSHDLVQQEKPLVGFATDGAVSDRLQLGQSTQMPATDTPDISTSAMPLPSSYLHLDSQHEATLSVHHQPSAATLHPRGSSDQAHSTVDKSVTWDLLYGNDLDLLWREIGATSSLSMPSSFGTNYPINLLPASHPGVSELDTAMFSNKRHDESRNTSGVRMPDFLPRQPAGQPSENYAQSIPENTKTTSSGRLLQPPSTPDGTGSPWLLSKADYSIICNSIEKHRSVLPATFTMPTRYALRRYVEGYFSGFHEHLPFIHYPTFSLVSQTPDLILAIAATGARYRFQRQQSHDLYISARALLEEQIRRRNGYEKPISVFSTPELLLDGYSHAPSCQSSVETPDQSTSDINCDNVKTMHAMIILMALGTWNQRSLIKDAFSIASELAFLVQEDGVGVGAAADSPGADLTWHEWVAAEERRRAKLVAFCFNNLLYIAYNIAPKLMNSDVARLSVPSPESHWRAASEDEWKAARSRDAIVETNVQQSYSSLFRNQTAAPASNGLSSFGNYVLIHCVVQQIFLARQLSFAPSGIECASLPPDLLLKFDSALRVWQHNWEATKDSSLDPSSPGGPLSFNSTALFRLAYIRLHADFGPCRRLETRNAERIAQAFRNAPLLERSPLVGRAVLQSAHSLSIPVRIGIEFVARTQTLHWSIVHSLCNLECGLFLGKWLETIANAMALGDTIQEDEKRLMGIVASIISETELGDKLASETDGVLKVKRMAVAVMQLWAYSFKGAHVFDIMGTIGAGLDICADMLQRELVTDDK